MLGPIAAVTISTPDVAQSVEIYERHLGYRCVVDSQVPAPLAQFWALPGLAGRRMALMVPASGAATYLRFIESAPDPDYRIFGSLGWNAAELIVEDVDALAARLDGGPFRIIGPPADLSFSDQIRAMQVVGPAQEVLYLTMAKSKLEAFDLPTARSFVDRVFIMILGGSSLEELQSWFAQHFALPPTPVIPSVISVLSEPYGLPADHLHPIAALPLAGQSYLELDQMPAAATKRRERRGELPPGIAMVTLHVDELPASLAGIRSDAPLELPPYGDRPAMLARGTAGELIELVATGP
ncbi:MAG TPA: hypothetical protein VLT59_17535 [Steroidobacteraceae bacterium]|nr:hypothetical protein [Steroidobacteraceae bacterium]